MLIGLVGKPSSGKSTFFKAATLAEVEIASYPFTTIKPNHGVGYVKIDCIDKEFETQCNPREGFCINHQRFVPVELMDVAGLVPGASEGKGLGNQFLDDLRQADAFIQIVDLSGKTNEQGQATDNTKVDIKNDINFLEKELDLWFSNILKKVWKTFARTIETSKSSFAEQVANQFSGLKVDEDTVKQVMLKLKLDYEKPTSWTGEEVFEFARTLRQISKPMIIATNKCDTEKAKENLKIIQDEFPDYPIVPCSAEAELALREAHKDELIKYIPGDKDFQIKKESKLNNRQKAALEFVQKNVLDIYKSTGVQDVLNKTVFELLEYIAVFPAGVNKLADSKGNVLPDCFLIPKGSTALDFAYKLHTDFGDNFARATDVKTKKSIGKDHELKHRDAIEIHTN